MTFLGLRSLLVTTVMHIFGLYNILTVKCLRFELLFWHMARYKCRLLTYLLFLSILASCAIINSCATYPS